MSEEVDISTIRGPMGWGIDDTMPIDARLDTENQIYDRLSADMPVAYKERAQAPLPFTFLDKYNKFLDAKGYGPGSVDMTHMEEFVFGKQFHWLPQKTGSCVISNTFRGWVRRAMFEIAIKGDPEEYFGTQEFGVKNFSFYAPFSYGCGRRRGNLKGGDGSWCEVQFESLIKDGVIMCNNGRLLEILTKLNSVESEDFPEPQNNAVYRRFQNWEFLDELLPFADWRLLETTKVTTIDQHDKCNREFKPMSVCSGIAIHKIGRHKDGFDIFAQNPRDSWPHNMQFHGHRIASDGDIFDVLSNESWGKRVIYYVPRKETERWYSRKLVSVQSIGEIDLPKSVPFI
jgi:hypothetical protein